MGRGYSAHRSHSKRLTNKTKRARSSSVLQQKKETVDVKPSQHHKRDFSAAPNTDTFSAAIANVESSTAKRRGVSEEKRAADALAASGRTRSESVKKVVYLGNKMVRSVNVTRHFSMKPKKQQPESSDESSSDDDETDEVNGEKKEKKQKKPKEIEMEEVHEDFMDDDEGPSENEEETIRRPDVFTKYVEAGKVVDAVLQIVAEACVPGANTKDLCTLGDQEIFNRVRGLFKNVNPNPNARADAERAKDRVRTFSVNGRSVSVSARSKSVSGRSSRNGVSNFERSRSSYSRAPSSNPMAQRFDHGLPRGVAFPTTVSVNETLCNHTPSTDAEAVTLKASDVIKIHCGVHVDGYPVTAARTIIVQADNLTIGDSNAAASAQPLPATAVNAIEASRVALAGAIHLMRPGAVNDDITDFIASVGAHYQSEAVEGVLSTRSKRWILDSVSSSIICRRVTQANPQQDVAYCEVEPQQIWCLDIAFTNSNSPKMQIPLHNNCNIYRKNEICSANPTLDDLRSKAATELLTQEIRTKFHCFPFTPLHADEPLRCRLGLVKLKKAGQIDSFQELHCKLNSAEDAEGRISKKNPSNDNRAITARFSATIAVTDKRIHVLAGGSGIISDEFASKRKAKDLKAAQKNANGNNADADIGGFNGTCGGLSTFEELYGSAFPTAALNAPSAEFESEFAPLFVRTPTDKLKGLLSSPLHFGKTVLSEDAVAAVSSKGKSSIAAAAADDEEEAVMVREDENAKRKVRRTEAPAAAPVMDAKAKAKLVGMHPKNTKK